MNATSVDSRSLTRAVPATERGPCPGLILEWRRTQSRDWQARVVYVPNGREQAVEMWLAAALLKPVADDPAPPSRAAIERARYGNVGGV